MTTNSDINPQHYKMIINGQEIQVVDIMEAFFPTDIYLAQAIKYMLRAGRKPDSSYIKDVSKCLWWCAKAILHHKGTIDLPPQAEVRKITIGGESINLLDTRKKK